MPKTKDAVAQSWDEVATRFETFGKHVRQHFASGSAASDADRVQLEKSARALVSTIEDTMAAAGGVIKDTKVRQDLAELAEAIRSAFVTSLDSAGTLIRTQVPQLDKLARTGRQTTSKAKTQPHKSVSHKGTTTHTHHDTDS